MALLGSQSSYWLKICVEHLWCLFVDGVGGDVPESGCASVCGQVRHYVQRGVPIYCPRGRVCAASCVIWEGR